MGKPITDPLADQCGNCKFWDQTDRKDGLGDCTGVPPTPILLGMRESRFVPGQADFQIDNIRPLIAPNARPCSLHKRALPTMIGQKSNRS